MSQLLATPSICVVDDEENDFRPLVTAMDRLGLGCIHVRGDDSSPLPNQPFNGLRLVFMDLHLSAVTGKNAASHSANVFKKVVSPNAGPIIVVIWSKYAHDIAAGYSSPEEDQPTEATLFKNELLVAEPRFQNRLTFLEMAKPKLQDRPSENAWVDQLKQNITSVIKSSQAQPVVDSELVGGTSSKESNVGAEPRTDIYKESESLAKKFDSVYPEDLSARLEWWRTTLGIDHIRFLRMLGLTKAQAAERQSQELARILENPEWQNNAWLVEGGLHRLLSMYGYDWTALAARLHLSESERTQPDPSKTLRRKEKSKKQPIASSDGDSQALLNQIANGGPDALLAVFAYLVRR